MYHIKQFIYTKLFHVCVLKGIFALCVEVNSVKLCLCLRVALDNLLQIYSIEPHDFFLRALPRHVGGPTLTILIGTSTECIFLSYLSPG